MVEDYWPASMRMLSDMKFLDQLKAFDKDNIPPAVIKQIRDRYITNRDFVPEKIKVVSTACEGLCSWVRAMDVYDRVAKIVAPKQLALLGAETELNEQMQTLNAKRAELQVILDKLQGLNDFFAEKSRQKKNLEDEIDNCEKKLSRYVTVHAIQMVPARRWHIALLCQRPTHSLHLFRRHLSVTAPKPCWVAWAAKKTDGPRTHWS